MYKIHNYILMLQKREFLTLHTCYELFLQEIWIWKNVIHGSIFKQINDI
jgi:hypothetical protein